MPASEVFAQGSTALITGAAAGIGLAIAKLCHSKGMQLLLVDVNADGLEAAKNSLSEGSATVATAVVDVSNTHQWETLKSTAMEQFGSIELLVLNAGKGMKGGWGDEDYFRQTLETNLFGVINGINVFLPAVKTASESKPTAIVITASKQGITNPPGNPAYNASKAAVKSLAEQLGHDLRHERTSVHLLVPGWTFTNLAGALHFKEKPPGAWLPEQVADFLYRKMEQDKFYVICPDNEVSEEMDKKRMLWAAGDIVYERPPLSRWHEDWKDEAADQIAKTQI